jgi:hypothetical protein
MAVTRSVVVKSLRQSVGTPIPSRDRGATLDPRFSMLASIAQNGLRRLIFVAFPSIPSPFTAGSSRRLFSFSRFWRKSRLHASTSRFRRCDTPVRSSRRPGCGVHHFGAHHPDLLRFVAGGDLSPKCSKSPGAGNGHAKCSTRDRDDERLLEALRSNPDGTIGDHATAIGKSKTSVVTALHRLRDLGLVESVGRKWSLAKQRRPAGADSPLGQASERGGAPGSRERVAPLSDQHCGGHSASIGRASQPPPRRGPKDARWEGSQHR